MHLALLSTGVHPGIRGGMQRHTYFLALHLARLGARVTLVHPREQELSFPEPESRAIQGVGVAWRALPGPYHYVPEYYLYSAGAAARLRASPGLHAIYGQGYTLWSYLRDGALPTIFSPHGLEQFQPQLAYDRVLLLPWRAIARYHAKRSTKAVSLGGKLTEYLVRNCGARPDQVSIIPNAVSLEHVDAHLGRDGQLSRAVVFAGRLARHKGLDILLKSLAQIPERDFVVEIMGDGPLRAWLVRQRDARLRWLGWREDGPYFARLSSAWGLVFSGRGEGMPTVILEAMAARVPVVATDVGAVRDVVTPGNGFLVPPGDPRALATALRRLLALTREERLRMGAAARASVEEKFTWDRVGRQTLGLLEEIAHPRGATNAL